MLYQMQLKNTHDLTTTNITLINVHPFLRGKDAVVRTNEQSKICFPSPFSSIDYCDECLFTDNSIIQWMLFEDKIDVKFSILKPRIGFKVLILHGR